MMKYSKFSIFLLLAATLTVVTAATIGVIQREIPSRGKVHIVSLGVDVFWDMDCNSQVSEIDWGTLEPGNSKNVSAYVKNTGNTALILSMNASDWMPVTAETYIAVTWDAENTSLSEGDVLHVHITLSVSAGISGVTDFQFSIFIIGGET